MRQNLHQSAAPAAFNGKVPHVSAPGLAKSLMRFLDRAKQRDDLSSLTDDQLRDIGVSRHEAEREAGKWFWE